MDDSSTSKELAQRLYERVFGAGDYDAADQLMASDHVSHGPGTPPSAGTGQIKRQAALLREAFPDLRVNLLDQIAEGDRVSSRWSGSGTHTGPLRLPAGTVEPTGRTITFEEIRIDRCDNNRIAESWFIPDRMTLWQQLGIL